MGSVGADQGRPIRHLWIPTFPIFVWIFFTVAVCFALAALGTIISRDGDPALHVTLGRLMIENGGLLSEDPTCFAAAPDKPFIAHEWLSQVLLALAHGAFGLAGPALLAVFLYAGCLALLTSHLVRTRTRASCVVACVLAAAVFLGFRLMARPHVFTWLFAAVWTILLERWRRGELSAARLAGLGILLMLPWANLHGGFLIAFVLAAIFAAGVAVDRRRGAAAAAARGRDLLPVVGAMALASLANPFGWRLHAHLVSFLADPEMAGASSEFQPLDLGGTAGVLFLVVAAAMGLALLRRGRALSTVHALLWILLVAMALRSGRHTALFALIVPLAALAGPAREVRPDATLDGRPLAAIAFAVTVVLAGWLGVPPTRFDSSEMPVEALAYVEANPELFEGRAFCLYRWGGYVVYERHPPQQVFVHGLNDHYGAAHVERYVRVRDARDDWQHVLRSFDVRWAVVSPTSPIAGAMEAESDWRRVHEDAVAVLFVYEPP